MATNPSLGTFRDSVEGCVKCALGEGRHHLVFGEGDPHARLMFIGEAPGQKEDELGRPFVGAAGKYLDQLLAGIGLSRNQVFITNVLKCRPPGNRDPLPEEIESCTPLLRQQVRQIAPLVLCTLGNFATKLILREDRGVSKIHGQVFELSGFKVVPVYHPAAALYNPRLRETMVADFRILSQVISE